MHDQPAILARQPDDWVAGNRATAVRQLNGRTFVAVDCQWRRIFCLVGAHLFVRGQTLCIDGGGRMALPDVGINVVLRPLAACLRQIVPSGTLWEVRQRV